MESDGLEEAELAASTKAKAERNRRSAPFTWDPGKGWNPMDCRRPS